MRFADEDYAVRVIARDERAIEAEIRGSRELAHIIESDSVLEIFRTRPPHEPDAGEHRRCAAADHARRTRDPW